MWLSVASSRTRALLARVEPPVLLATAASAQQECPCVPLPPLWVAYRMGTSNDWHIWPALKVKVPLVAV